MRLVGFLLLAVSLTTGIKAAEIYVAEHGDDRNSGRTPKQALRTLAAGLTKAGRGDAVLLPRGQVFRPAATLEVQAGVTLSGFGPDRLPLPVICGSRPLRLARKGTDRFGWHGRTQAWGEDDGPAFCYWQGRPLSRARFPDAGWLFCAEGSTAERLVLPDDPRLTMDRLAAWEGAVVRWRKGSWWFERRPVRGVAKRALRLGGESSIPGLTPVGSGFYIDGCGAELDAPGEWHWFGDERGLMVIAPDGVDDAELTIDVAVIGVGVRLRGGALRQVELRHHHQKAIAVTAPSRVEDCLITWAGESAIATSWNAGGTRIHGNILRDCWDNGLNINENPAGATGTMVSDNRLERIGMVPAQGGHGPWHQSGIVISNGNEIVVEGNRIEKVGYCGIILGSDGQTVRRNLIRRAMATLNDGAGIYTNCNRSNIRENVVIGSVGCLDSSHPWTPLGHGIWLEFLQQFRESEVIGNTVVGCGGHGIFLPNNYECRIAENVLAANRLAGLHLAGSKKPVPKRQEHTIRDNLLAVGIEPFAGPEGERLAEWSRHNDFQRCLSYQNGFHYGSLSGTIFVLPDPRSALIADNQHTRLDVQAWRKAAEWADPRPRGHLGRVLVLINDAEAEAEMVPPRGAAWKTLDGADARRGVSVAPWRSRVVIAHGRVAGSVPQWLLASAIAP